MVDPRLTSDISSLSANMTANRHLKCPQLRAKLPFCTFTFARMANNTLSIGRLLGGEGRSKIPTERWRSRCHNMSDLLRSKIGCCVVVLTGNMSSFCRSAKWPHGQWTIQPGSLQPVAKSGYVDFVLRWRQLGTLRHQWASKCIYCKSNLSSVYRGPMRSFCVCREADGGKELSVLKTSRMCYKNCYKTSSRLDLTHWYIMESTI